MTPEFFSLKTPRDMLEKAKRERLRLAESPTVDNAFNFFVTARHIVDYAKKASPINQFLINNFEQDSDIKALCDIGDKGKHLTLTRNDRIDPVAERKLAGLFNAPYGTVSFGQTVIVWKLELDGKRVDLFEFADTIIEKWEKFLSENEQ
ncbi:hypothetical protein [Herbaspirillum autotrophicum]|uniref:hypothetical protein n=1 Tax=Herbaspirillum autotrophicum TaxID=180195 RepID=UPI00067DC680|nr:hypothetical protein [Herbaspirillum autotrophicum]